MAVQTRKKKPALLGSDVVAEGSTPLHSQIREAIRSQVRDGKLIDGTGRLMTEAELCRHFGVSRITIRNAIAPLVNEGMFDRSRGRGTFLRSNQPENWVGRLMGFSETIRGACGLRTTRRSRSSTPSIRRTSVLSWRSATWSRS
jgi:GntR family transcriptional regulator